MRRPHDANSKDDQEQNHDADGGEYLSHVCSLPGMILLSRRCRDAVFDPTHIRR